MLSLARSLFSHTCTPPPSSLHPTYMPASLRILSPPTTTQTTNTPLRFQPCSASPQASGREYTTMHPFPRPAVSHPTLAPHFATSTTSSHIRPTVSLQQMVLFGQNPSQGTLLRGSQFLLGTSTHPPRSLALTHTPHDRGAPRSSRTQSKGARPATTQPQRHALHQQGQGLVRPVIRGESSPPAPLPLLSHPPALSRSSSASLQYAFRRTSAPPFSTLPQTPSLYPNPSQIPH